MTFTLGRECDNGRRNNELTWNSLEKGKYLIIVNIVNWWCELGHKFTVNRYSDKEI